MKIFPLEFSSFENLFKDKKLVIPYYQRDYIWKKDNWEKWLKDVKKLIECEDIEEIHFIGSIIYKKNPETNPSSPEYLIIDGQQRITTFFIFCLAILEILKRDNHKKNSFLVENINQLLFLPDRYGPRLTMRGEDEKSLEAILSHKNLENDEQRVSEAYHFFRKSLGGSSMTRLHLKDYFERLKSGVKFISVKLEKEDDALEIFKSINTSGVMLTSVDLIKAEFFIIYEEKGLGSECEKLAEEWENMKKSVGKENISHFFYVFLLVKYGKGEYSEKEFYSYFRNKLFQEKENIEKLWNETIQKSRIYSQIINPQSDYWGENFYLPILEIKMLDLKQLYPLIFFLKEKELQGKKEATILKKLIVYSFRIRTKRINFQQSEVLKLTKLAQNDQLDSILSDPNIVKEAEKSIHFWDELEEKQNLKEGEIKWLLTKFYLTFLPEGYFLFPLQLEHMFPKKPDKEWWSIPEWKGLEEDKKQIKEKLSSLGNAALLTPNQNIAAGNKVWNIKKEEFRKKTCLQYEKNALNLLKKSTLLPKDIDDRKKWLIKEFKKTGILFIDEKKEKPQIEVELEG